MATRPGEDLAATLFADAHYFYGPPSAKPPHHRFDKGSYVYLFENANQRRARIEIANNAGTLEQDAFTGHLDSTHVEYSYRHSALVTLTVDGKNGQPNSPSPTDTQEWHLPTFDPKNENKYMYRLHSLDIYFWTKEDALQFVNGIRRVLPPQQISIRDEPVAPPPQSDAISPVVQKLENVAISDPSYQNGRTKDSRTASTGFAAPPLSALPNSQGASNFTALGFQQQVLATTQAPPPAAFAPLAYNPAAPAAPEAIKHREKTPPPADGGVNPLAAAATTEHGQTYGVPFHAPGFPAPPGPPGGAPSALQQPLQSPYAQHFQNSFAPPPPAYQAQPSPRIPVNQYASYPGSQGMQSPGMSTPGIYSPGLTSPGLTSPGLASPGYNLAAGPQASYAPAAPPGGFSQYNYNPNLSNTQPLMTDYSIHQQVYRPTEGEAAIKNKPARAPTGKLEQKAGQLEKGVTGLFKKLEKKYG